jgi:MFS family permease
MDEPGSRKPSIFKAKALISLQNPTYRLVLFGSMAQMASMTMQMVTNPLLIFRLTGSPALLGLMSLAGALPTILIGLFGGAVADRVQKRTVLITCFSLMAVISLSIGLALDSGLLSKEHAGSWWILIVASVIQGSVMGLMMPSLMAIVPEVVKRENLMNASALNNLSMAGISLLIPSLAGVLIDKVGFEAIFYLATGFYAAAIVIFFFVRLSRRRVTGSGQILANVTDGLKYIRQNATIMYILIFSMMVIVLSTPYQQFLPIYVDDILHVGATGLGFLMSMSGAGSLVGSLVLTTLPNRKRGLLLLSSGTLAAVALGIFAFSSAWGLSLALMMVSGLASALRATISSALLQSHTDALYMGRVLSLTHIQFGVSSVATFFVGLLAEVVHVQWVIGVMAMVLFALTLAALLSNRYIRELD